MKVYQRHNGRPSSGIDNIFFAAGVFKPGIGPLRESADPARDDSQVTELRGDLILLDPATPGIDDLIFRR